MKRVTATLGLIALLALLAFDTSFRFDEERVILKRQNQSAQRHWSWFFKQVYTYHDSPFRYQYDLNQISEILEPNKVLISDKATSYYLASELPVYVKNVQRHHFRDNYWNRILEKNYFCYIEFEESLKQTKEFLNKQKVKDKQLNKPEVKYWLINRDSNNLNLRYDCLATRGLNFLNGFEGWANLVYEGEYLWLYEIN